MRQRRHLRTKIGWYEGFRERFDDVGEEQPDDHFHHRPGDPPHDERRRPFEPPGQRDVEVRLVDLDIAQFYRNVRGADEHRSGTETDVRGKAEAVYRTLRDGSPLDAILSQPKVEERDLDVEVGEGIGHVRDTPAQHASANRSRRLVRYLLLTWGV